MALDFNLFNSKKIKETFKKFQTLINQTSNAAAKNSHNINKVALQANLLAQNLEKLFNSADNLKKLTSTITQLSHENNQTAQKMSEQAQTGLKHNQTSFENSIVLTDKMTLAKDSIDSLFLQFEAITKISNVIENMAFKTELLAFNAAIEAERAGESGSGFKVVAEEFRLLSQKTAQENLKIISLLKETEKKLKPAHQSLNEVQLLITNNNELSQELNSSLNELAKTVQTSADYSFEVNANTQQQDSAVDDIFKQLENAKHSCLDLTQKAFLVKNDTQTLIGMTEKAFEDYELFDEASTFRCALKQASLLASDIETLFKESINSQQLKLQDFLNFKYTQIQNENIKNLKHLFNVDKVPSSGFTPAKFNTSYDLHIDLKLRNRLDQTKQTHKEFVFAIVVDLNSYAPVHNSDYCKDWQNNPDLDLAGNRAKRFFNDTPALLRAARFNLCENVNTLPLIINQDEYEKLKVHFNLHNSQKSDQKKFLVQTYTRDTGAVLSILSVPIYIQTNRWGSAIIGWTENTPT